MYFRNRLTGEEHCAAGPSALIGARNFELAVATAISVFGFTSGAALATAVGVLIEVSVMLGVVSVVNRRRGWYEKRVIAECGLGSGWYKCTVATLFAGRKLSAFPISICPDSLPMPASSSCVPKDA